MLSQEGEQGGGQPGGDGGHRGGSRKRRRSRGIFGEKLCQGEYISIRLENAKLGLGSSDGQDYYIFPAPIVASPFLIGCLCFFFRPFIKHALFLGSSIANEKYNRILKGNQGKGKEFKIYLKIEGDDEAVKMLKEVIYRGRQLSKTQRPLNKLDSTPDISGNCF